MSLSKESQTQESVVPLFLFGVGELWDYVLVWFLVREENNKYFTCRKPVNI